MNAKKIGEKLVKLRGQRTQSEVAEAVGISTSALSMYECGERIPRDTIKVLIANYFETTIESLFFDQQ